MSPPIKGQSWELADVKVLCVRAHGPGGLASKKSVKTLEDLKGHSGLPYLTGGSNPNGPGDIPVLCVNGLGGEAAMYATNADLVATIGADALLQLGIADYGKGMGWVSFDFVVPAAGLYPLHMVYEQGGACAGLEWATVASPTLAWDDVSRAWVNDSATTNSLVSYRSVTGLPTPTVKIVKEGGVYNIYYTGTLVSAPAVGGTCQAVPGAQSPYTVPTGAGPSMFYRTRN